MVSAKSILRMVCGVITGRSVCSKRDEKPANTLNHIDQEMIEPTNIASRVAPKTFQKFIALNFQVKPYIQHYKDTKNSVVRVQCAEKVSIFASAKVRNDPFGSFDEKGIG